MFLVEYSVPDLVPPIMPPRPRTPDLSEITPVSYTHLRAHET